MPLLTINSPKLYYTGGIALDIDAPLDINSGLTALTGPNGAGKTVLARIIEKGWNFRTNNISSPTGKKPEIRYIEFNDVHSWTGNSVEYYQQRYEAAMNDEVPTVAQIMGEKVLTERFCELAGELRLHDASDKKINFLSSGELRKLIIIDSLLEEPALLIIDNPYIGLDAEAKQVFNKCLERLRHKGVSVMLVTADERDLPVAVDKRIHASRMRISTKVFSDEASPASYEPFGFRHETEIESHEIIEMHQCRVNYGSATVIDRLNWTVKAGERWSLSGPNGSGKSTLLSFVCADNPKSYCTDLSLFGRRRGSGESIWDIKRLIGYVSPEMQLHFHSNGTLEQIIASGLNDTVGLYVKPTEPQLEQARRWLRHFRLTRYAQASYASLSSGQRQLALIARAIIKEPRLLILDEPMHALDADNRRLVDATINEFLETRSLSAFIMVTHCPDELPKAITNHLKLPTANS